VFTTKQKASLASVSLARIICDNSGIGRVPRDPFRFTSSANFKNCGDIPALDLNPWIEIGKFLTSIFWCVDFLFTFETGNAPYYLSS